MQRDPWAAQIELDAASARSLLAAQFPQLAPETIRPLGQGWDNAAFVVNGSYVVRFPRRSIAAQLIATECAILPMLAPLLPLVIPAPTIRGEPSAAFPWPFAGYRLLPGESLSALRPSDAACEALVGPLGAFLRALHAVDAGPALAAGLPADELGRLDRARTMPKLCARLEELRVAGFAHETRLAAAYLERVATRHPASIGRCVVHGDLYARHILVDETLRPIAVIDWGDVHFGDPAVDLSIAFSVLPGHLRGAFFDAYGGADERTIELARYRAVYHSALVAHYGCRIGDADLLYAGLLGLRQGCADGEGVGP